MTRQKYYQQQISSPKTWAAAMQWVNGNKRLVRQIASPYVRFMAGDSEDLYQEATISAYNTLLCCKKNGRQERFIPFFRVIFKTNCIKLASGIPACLAPTNLIRDFLSNELKLLPIFFATMALLSHMCRDRDQTIPSPITCRSFTKIVGSK